MAHNRIPRINALMHRNTVVDAEADDYCAPEGACPRDAYQGRGPDCPTHPRAEATPHIWRWLGVSAALVAGAVFVVWWLA